MQLVVKKQVYLWTRLWRLVEPEQTPTVPRGPGKERKERRERERGEGGKIVEDKRDANDWRPAWRKFGAASAAITVVVPLLTQWAEDIPRGEQLLNFHAPLLLNARNFGAVARYNARHRDTAMINTRRTGLRKNSFRLIGPGWRNEK